MQPTNVQFVPLSSLVSFLPSFALVPCIDFLMLLTLQKSVFRQKKNPTHSFCLFRNLNLIFGYLVGSELTGSSLRQRGS